MRFGNRLCWFEPSEENRHDFNATPSRELFVWTTLVLRVGSELILPHTTVLSLDEIKSRIEVSLPGASLQIIANDSPAAQASLLLAPESAISIARFLHDDPELRLDYLSNVTGVDWLDSVAKEKIKVRKVLEGVEKEVDEIVERKKPGYLEAVYHLYSMTLKHGPVIVRLRTENRTDKVRLPSMTSVWRSAEFQEREIFDLYGIIFDGHADLRRILMWDNFEDHPMRKDYREPDDYEYEPTPHDKVLEKAKKHHAAPAKA